MIRDGEEFGRADRDGVGAPRSVGFGEEGVRETDDAASSKVRAPSMGIRGALEAYRGTGHELIRLHGWDDLGADGKSVAKMPSKGWRSSPPLTVDEAQACIDARANVGVRLRPSDLVLDVDPRNFRAGDDPLERLGAELKIDFDAFPIVHTGGGGRHIYMCKPAGVRTREALADYAGLEFKTAGRQVVAAGSIHPNGNPYWWDNDPLGCPLSLISEAPAALIDLIARPDADGCVEGGARSPDELATMLTGLNVLHYNGKQDDWLKLMMACHDATGGEGREAWIEWCVGDPDYADAADEIGVRWDSLKVCAGGGGVTERTLFKALVDAGRLDLLPAPDAGEDFPDDLPEAEAQSPTEAWVWVADAEQFVRRSDGKKYRALQWKSMHAPLYPDGDVVNAVFKGKLPMKKFESLVYIPGRGEFPDGGGQGRYNIWRPSGVKPTPGDVGPFLDHMRYLIPDETERNYALDYMAYLLQRPEGKIHFALLMQGLPGTGKSWLGKLMELMIGTRNIVRPSNAEVNSNWTVWAEGAQLAVIEELMLSGKLEIANRLKPIITDDTIRIEEKGCSLYSIPNHLNLMCFTNHENALPLEKGDRRWLVVFSPAEPLEPSYYEKLFDYLRGAGPAAVSHWLRQRRIRLDVKGVAPITAGKASMLAASMDDVEAYIREQLDEGAEPFDFDLVRVDEVAATLPGDLKGGAMACRHRVARALKAVGALQHVRYTKGDRPSWSLWSLRNHDAWTKAGAARRIDAYVDRRG